MGHSRDRRCTWQVLSYRYSKKSSNVSELARGIEPCSHLGADLRNVVKLAPRLVVIAICRHTSREVKKTCREVGVSLQCTSRLRHQYLGPRRPYIQGFKGQEFWRQPTQKVPGHPAFICPGQRTSYSQCSSYAYSCNEHKPLAMCITSLLLHL